MRRKTWQKILSLALCVMMLSALLPAALAEDTGAGTAPVMPLEEAQPDPTDPDPNPDPGSDPDPDPAPEEVKVTAVSVSPSSVALKVDGASAQVSASVQPENATNKNVTWTSSNMAVATVANGLITPVAAGTCTVTATAADGSGVSGSVTVTVTEPEPAEVKVTAVSVSPSSVALKVDGASAQISASVQPENATNKNVTWTSSNTAVATVVNGLITPVAAGTCTVTATAADGSGVSGSVTVTVNEPEPPKVPVTGIALDRKAVTINAGDSHQMKATVAPENATNKNVTWSSSDANVATVDANGLIQAVGGGSCTVTATAADGSGVHADVQVTVIQPVTGISVSPAVLALGVQDSYKLQVTVSPADASNKGVSFASSDVSIAAVASDGSVIAQKIGTATITVTSLADPSKKATCVVNVGVPVKGVSVSPTAVELNTGVSQQLSVSVTPDNATIKTVNWTTSDPTVATVDAKGVVKTWKAGTATITATAADGSGKSAACTVTVKGQTVDKPTDPEQPDKPTVVPVQSISLSPASVTVAKGATYQLNPEILPANATNKAVTYTSSNPSVVAVAGSGLVTGNTAGTATVTVTSVADNTKVATCVITVGVPVSSVSFGMTAVSIQTGKSLTIPVTVLPNDASNKTLIWASSDNDVATVSNDGVVKAWKAGKATITATSADGSNKSVGCTVTVSGETVAKPTPTPTPTPVPTPTPTPGPQVPAGQYAFVNTEKGGLNLRKNASQGSTRLLIIPENASFIVVTYGKTWCYAWYNGTYGYVMTKFVRLAGTTSSPSGNTPTPTPAPEAPKGQTAFVHTEKGGLNMRKSASQNASRLLVIPENGSFTVVTYGKTWCYAWYNGTYGYVMTKFLRLAGETDMPSESDKPTPTPTPGPGAGDARVTTANGGLNLRTGAGTGYKRIAIIPQNAYVKVITRGVTWCYVTYGGKTGYVMTKFLTFNGSAPTTTKPGNPTPPPAGSGYAQVTTETGGLNLRRGPGMGYTRTLIIPQNAYVQVLTKGAEWSWVSYNGKTGYVMTKFLRIV